MDAGKCVSFRLGVPVVICPTIASTDAPCSAVSVMYTREGVGIGPEFFSNSPALVVVDTAKRAEITRVPLGDAGDLPPGVDPAADVQRLTTPPLQLAVDFVDMTDVDATTSELLGVVGELGPMWRQRIESSPFSSNSYIRTSSRIGYLPC